MNYQKELEKKLIEIQKENSVPRLLLHSCCAPCSSYVLEYLSEYFEITVFYYNPNIYPDEEYEKRVEEQNMLIRNLKSKYPVTLQVGEFDKERFYAMAKGKEQLPEGGERCYQCYRLRLEEAAKMAKDGAFDYFTTTLSISPLKKADWLNEIGKCLSEAYGVQYLCSDFKKKNGYKRSIELSRIYGLYRQDYCGCVFSYQESKKRQEQKNKME